MTDHDLSKREAHIERVGICMDSGISYAEATRMADRQIAEMEEVRKARETAARGAGVCK
jgi:hypothetical protein